MTKPIRRISGILLFLALFTTVLELGLRAIPTAIPLGILSRYQKDLRLSIARRLEFWNESQMREIERDDGGPNLRVFKPNSRIHFNFRDTHEHGTMELDGQGFCNQRLDLHDQPSVDVVTLGDSFAWCISIEPRAAWASQLGLLTGRTVLNLGRGGIGPYEYLQILRHFGLPRRPEVVVMQIYEGNDLRDALRYRDHVVAARKGRILYADASDRGRRALDYDTVLDDPIGRNSYAVNFLVVAIAEGATTVGRTLFGDARTPEDFRFSILYPERRVEMNVENADESEVRTARQVRAGEIDFRSSTRRRALRSARPRARLHAPSSPTRPRRIRPTPVASSSPIPRSPS